MRNFQSSIALLCVWLVAAPWTFAQEGTRKEDTTPRLDTESPHWYSRFTNPYNPRIVPPVSVSNSSRLDSLLRGGKLYLSLTDAVALGVENNLDVEVQRYEFPMAQADLLRAQAGASILGIPTAVTTGVPTGTISTNILGLLNTGVTSVGANTFLPLGLSFDPAVIGTISWGHNTTPLSNSVVSGLTTSVTNTTLGNFGISQGFITGGSATLSYNNSDATSNSFTNIYNPATTSSLDLAVTQPLLQGFGFAVNNRTIRIARNNLKAADLVFKQQVTNVVANVIQLYWSLVYFNNDADVKRRAVAVSEKLYNDNKKQVEVGTLAPISVVQAQAQMATDQQALVQSETNVLQQEAILKSTLSRNGLASPSVSEARVVPTDPFRVPEVEAIEPIQDLVARALDNRPELAQSRIQIENSKISITGIRNLMLPTLNAIADLRNNALSGTPNTVVNPVTGYSIVTNPLVTATRPDQFFVGGYGNVLSQLFSRNFPTYTVGVSLNIPIRNRAAQANMNTAELVLRQNELTVQKEINQIRVDVQTALIAVQQARAQYQAASQAVVLQQQTTDAEEKKLAAGASTPYNVILTQRDLATAEDNQVLAEAAYAFARNQLDWATGTILDKNNVQFEEAKQGIVSRPPSALPVLNR